MLKSDADFIEQETKIAALDSGMQACSTCTYYVDIKYIM